MRILLIEVNGEKITADNILSPRRAVLFSQTFQGLNMRVLTLMVSSNLAHYQKRVAVVGAGYIAVELAGVLNALGSETHLFVRKTCTIT